MSFAIEESLVDDETIQEWREKLWVLPTRNSHNIGNPRTKREKAGVRAITSVEIPRRGGTEVFIVVPMEFGRKLYPDVNDDRRHKRVRLRWKIKLLPHQVSIDRDCRDALETRRSCFLRLRPGTGKTFISCHLASLVGLLTVVLVKDSTLIQQWYKSIEESLSGARIFIVGGKNKDYPTGKPPADPNIYICLFTRWSKMDILLRIKVGLVIIDECHTFCNNSGVASILAFPFTMYTIGCSATPTRSRDGMSNIIDHIFGKKRINTTYVMKMKMIEFTTGFEAKRVDGHHGINWTKLYQSLINNPERNKLIVDLAQHLLDYGRKPMFVCNEKQHVELLAFMMTERGINCDYIHGNKKDYDDSDVLIGNYQKVGTGFDERTYCKNFKGKRINCVVAVVSIGNVEGVEQIFGRSFRSKKPLIVYLVDDDKTVIKHWKLCLNWVGRLEYDRTDKDVDEPVCEVKMCDIENVEDQLEEWYA